MTTKIENIEEDQIHETVIIKGQDNFLDINTNIDQDQAHSVKGRIIEIKEDVESNQ